MPQVDAGHLTDAQARNLVIKSLRQARIAFRKSDTMGERLEREFDRLIKRQTRINSGSMVTLDKLYREYGKLVAQISIPLGDAYAVTSQF